MAYANAVSNWTAADKLDVANDKRVIAVTTAFAALVKAIPEYEAFIRATFDGEIIFAYSVRKDAPAVARKDNGSLTRKAKSVAKAKPALNGNATVEQTIAHVQPQMQIDPALLAAVAQALMMQQAAAAAPHAAPALKAQANELFAGMTRQQLIAAEKAVRKSR